MNLTVLTEQAEDPALRNLSRLAVLQPLAPGEMGFSAPIVILGTITGNPPRYLNALCQQAYRSDFPVLFFPPWPAGSEISNILASPARMSIEAGAGDQVSLSDTALCSAMGKDSVSIRCDQVIATPLSTGVLARNQLGPVLLRFRPTNTATPIFITTLQVLIPSSRSVALDREMMIKAILQLALSDIRFQTKSTRPNSTRSSTTTDEIRLVVLALAYLRNTRAQSIQEFIQSRLYANIALENISSVLIEFQRAGYLKVFETDIQVDLVAINKLVSSLGLTAFLRELEKE